MTDQLLQKFLSPPIPANETERLAALHRYKILDTPPEAAFDRITNLAARLFKMPIALISLVDKSRAWFKSCIGFNASEVSREATLCSFAVLTDEPLIIPDARLDDRFACNPFVQSEPGVRFYAGAPLLNHDGFNLGTLCLLDSEPHPPLSAEQQATLVDLAAMVVDELELRLAALKIAQVDAALMEITQGVATVTGDAFIDALVRHFAKVLDTDYVYIGLVEGDDPKLLRTIATFAQGQIVDNLIYPLRDTPCSEAIAQRKICCYPRNVQAHFPDAPLLKPLCVESYIAAPFFDSNGTTLGLVGVMDGEPLENVHLAESLLTIFASRIATELERQHSEMALRQSQAIAEAQLLEIAAIYQTAPVGLAILDTDLRFVRINQKLAEINGVPIEGHLGRTLCEMVPELADEVEPLFRQILETGEPILDREIRGQTKAQPGVYRTWIESWYPLKNANGQVIGINTVVQEITERKQTEEALRKSEERYRAFVTHSGEGIWRFELEEPLPIAATEQDQLEHFYRYAYLAECNQVMARMYGFSSVDEIIGARLGEFMPQGDPRNLDYLRAFIGAGYRLEDAQSYEVDRFGNAKYFINNLIGIIQDGLLVRAWGTQRDISARKAAETALAKNEARLRGFVDANVVGMLYGDIYGNIHQANDELLRIVGYTREDLRSGRLRWVDITPPEWLPLDEQAIAEARARGACTPYEKEYIRQDGSRVPVLLGYSLVGEAREESVAFILDLSEQKQAEAARRESQALFEAFMRYSPASAFIKDEYGRYLYVNPLNERICKLPLADWLGKTDFDLFPIEEAQQGYNHDLAVMAAGEVIEIEEISTQADGQHYFVSFKFPIVQSSGRKLLGGFSLDVTERKQAELQLQRQASELQQLNVALEQTASKLSERNQELDRFVYTVSHDLKAPLRAIHNLSQWIADDLEGQLDEENLRQMQLLQSRVTRMEALIEGLLAYSRIGRTEVVTERVRVGELLDEILDSLTFPSTFTISVHSGMPTLFAKKMLLSQVFANLISNAIKHNDRLDGRIEIGAIQKGEYHEFSIVDNGPGIPPEYHERVFGIFQTLKGLEVPESTGIGLSIVKKIVETEGGSIVLESNLGEGATFRFTWVDQHEAA